MHRVHQLLGQVDRFLSGEDIFISYSRGDATIYATGLANRLTEAKFSCLFDQWSASPGKRIPASFRRAIRHSSLCVLVCTKEAAGSPNVADEIAEFLKTGRTIVPIDVADHARKAIWWPLVEGLKWEVEEESALVSGNPSANVLNRIHSACSFSTKDRRLRRSTKVLTSVLAVLLFLAIGGAGLAWFYLGRATEAGQKASAAQVQAKKQLEAAKNAADLAARKTSEAEKATDRANNAAAAAASADESRRSAIARLLTTRAMVAEGEGDVGLLASTYLVAESLSREETTANRSLLAELLASSFVQLPPLAQDGPVDIAFQPHGSYLAIRSGNSIRVLDPSRTSVREFRFAKRAWAMAWSPDGKLLVGGADGGEIGIWSVDSGERVAKLACEGNPGEFSVHPTGNALLAACSGGGSFLWQKQPDWPEERPPCFHVNGFDVRGIFSPDGESIAVSSLGRGLTIVNYPSLKTVAEIPLGGRDIRQAVFDPSGSGRVAIADNVGMVTVWHSGDAKPVSQMHHPGDCVADLAFSADGKRLATACIDGVARLFETATGSEIGRVATGARLNSVALDSTGLTMATAGREPVVRFWRIPPLGDRHVLVGETVFSGPKPYLVRSQGREMEAIAAMASAWPPPVGMRRRRCGTGPAARSC